MLKQVLLGVVGLAVLAGVASAGPGFVPQTVTVNAPGAMNSVGPVGHASNSSFMHTFTGPAFRVGAIRIAGTLTNGSIAGNWANDASWNIANDNGLFRNYLGITAVEGYTGPINVGPTNYAIPATPLYGYTHGTWTFQSYEGFDDEANTSTVENIWNAASFEFVEMTPAATPSLVQSLGALSGSTSVMLDHANPNAVHWLSFDFAGGPGSHIEIDTLGTNIPIGLNPLGDNDTEIALYDHYGVLVYTNDNIDLAGGELESRIITGDDVLPAGTYYLAVTAFDATVGISNFGFANNSPYTDHSFGTGPIQVNITVVPAPATAALVGLGGLVAGRRRRAR